MNDEQKISKVQYITCPICEGSGRVRSKAICSNCGGLGQVGFFRDYFYYWHQDLNKALIKFNHLKAGLNLAVNISVYSFGILGLIALAWWVWLIGNSASPASVFLFWRSKNIFILIFWISVIADMFIYYRLSREKAIKHKIKKLNYRDEVDPGSAAAGSWAELKKINKKYKINVGGALSYNTGKFLEQAYLLTDKIKSGALDTPCLFFCLLKDNEIAAIFSRLNADGLKIASAVKNLLLAAKPGEAAASFTSRLSEVMIESYILAMKLGQNKIHPIHLLMPLIAKDENIKEILLEQAIDENKIYNVIQWFVINEAQINNYRLYKRMAGYKPANAMDRAYTAVATPILNHFCYDLTLAAKWGRLELCVSREKEVNQIFNALVSGRLGVILVGQVGVGKNMIINQIARLMVSEEVPKVLEDKRLVELDVARLLSGLTATAAEERLMVIIDEIARAGNIILYISEVENLIGITQGAEESLDLSEVLAKSIENKELICLTSTTTENYVKYLENKMLGNILIKIAVDQPETDLAIQIIESKVGYFETKYKAYFSYNALAKAVELTDKYIHDKYLPAKAIELLELLAVKAVRAKGKNCVIDENDVAGIINEITHIPLMKITESESQNLLNLEERMHLRLVGQDEAVNLVAASLRRARTELRDSKRPIASFLFLGPTGVGKTELAKTMAETYFGREDYMIRLDMSEYQHQDSIDKMIGSPAGVFGYLTEKVRQRPFALILLDEFEKAHADILNLFLQVMDDGRLTDGQGRTIDFTNTIIIATSNVGAVFIQEQLAQPDYDLVLIKNTLVNNYLSTVFKPELLNRFDGLVVFKPLNTEHTEKIVVIMLDKVKKMLESKGINLEFTDSSIKKLASLGFDLKFGARPLRRVIQEKIDNEIANKILSGELARRDTVMINDDLAVKIMKGKKL